MKSNLSANLPVNKRGKGRVTTLMNLVCNLEGACKIKQILHPNDKNTQIDMLGLDTPGPALVVVPVVPWNH